MAQEKKKKTPGPKKKTVSRKKLIDLYMEHILSKGEVPRTVYKFAKENNFNEEQFYKHFGSFEGLKKAVWRQFYSETIKLMNKSSEVKNYGSRNKLLTFFFTFFELLKVNRSYVFFALHEHSHKLKNLEQLKGLRKDVKSFAKDLVAEDNHQKNYTLLRRSEHICSEGAWLQTLCLMKFWIDDESKDFEKTDQAIEKSVNTIFDLLDNTPLESAVDLGKFLVKEKIG